jgi:hypothetical protein
MTTRFVALTILGAVALCEQSAMAQGCIVARSSSQISGPETEGGYLSPGEWDISFGERHQFSFRHFVGDVEQKQRLALGTEVMNKINLLNATATYQLNPRFSFSFSAPILLASRRSNNSPYTTTAQGLGDISFGTQMWIFDPRERTASNIQVGFSFALPTGRDNVTNTVNALNGKGPQPLIVDYSIQPGTGGYGLTFSSSAFKSLPWTSQLYINGNYTATPQNYNNVLRSASAANQPLTAYNSISDQYLVEAGVAHVIKQVRGLTVTFGPRWEGVPAKDLIGDSLGFRRPGYALSVAPGFQYSYRKSLVTFEMGKAILRDRTRSVPDRILGTHGDAAFADYVWLGSYSYRFGGRQQHKPLDAN